MNIDDKNFQAPASTPEPNLILDPDTGQMIPAEPAPTPRESIPVPDDQPHVELRSDEALIRHKPVLNDRVGLSPRALKRADVKVDGSEHGRVTRIKMLAAALYSEMESLQSEARGNLTGDAQAAAINDSNAAMTQIHSGAMLAISAATAS